MKRSVWKTTPLVATVRAPWVWGWTDSSYTRAPSKPILCPSAQSTAAALLPLCSHPLQGGIPFLPGFPEPQNVWGRLRAGLHLHHGAVPALMCRIPYSEPGWIPSLWSCRQDDSGTAECKEKLAPNNSLLFLWTSPIFLLSFQKWENPIKLTGAQWIGFCLSRTTNPRTERNTATHETEKTKMQTRKITKIKKKTKQ